MSTAILNRIFTLNTDLWSGAYEKAFITPISPLEFHGNDFVGYMDEDGFIRPYKPIKKKLIKLKI